MDPPTYHFPGCILTRFFASLGKDLSLNYLRFDFISILVVGRDSLLSHSFIIQNAYKSLTIVAQLQFYLLDNEDDRDEDTEDGRDEYDKNE
jgi:hypothetical protein